MESMNTILWCSFLVSTFQSFVHSNSVYDVRYHGFSAEGKLCSKLLAGYGKLAGTYGRPIFNSSNAVPVRFMLQLIQLVDLDEHDQVLKLNLWTYFKWIDEFLRWNPDDFQGVQEIRIPSDKIWTPDIKLYNYADLRISEKRDALCIVKYDGHITWIPQGIYMSTCDIDVTRFPFDKHACSLKFGSWAYDGMKLDLDFDGPSKMETEDYFVPNKAWAVLDAPAERHVTTYSCCSEQYIDLTYTIIFRRSATFYIYTLVLPCILLSSLTLVLYWIPPESPTKMALGMIIFMAFFVLLRLFGGMVPPSSDNVPILGTYFCMNMIIITASIFLNVFVVNLSFYGARAPVPRIMKKLMFGYVAKCMCMENLVRPFVQRDKQLRCRQRVTDMVSTAGDDHRWPKHCRESFELIMRRKNIFEAHPQYTDISSKLNEVTVFLKLYFERIENKDQSEKIAKEWKAIGLIFDRCFFWIYLVTILTSIAVLLYNITMNS